MKVLLSKLNKIYIIITEVSTNYAINVINSYKKDWKGERERGRETERRDNTERREREQERAFAHTVSEQRGEGGVGWSRGAR